MLGLNIALWRCPLITAGDAGIARYFLRSSYMGVSGIYIKTCQAMQIEISDIWPGTLRFMRLLTNIRLTRRLCRGRARDIRPLYSLT